MERLSRQIEARFNQIEAIYNFEHGNDLRLPCASYWLNYYLISMVFGEISPVGIGKLVASIEVFLGLVTVAIFVGKVASERQVALLTLVYTSEHHRRITSFIESIMSLNVQVFSALMIMTTNS